MKKGKHGLSFCIIILLFVCALFFVNFNVFNSFNISTTTSAKMYNTENFISALTDMTKQNPISENSVIFFEKNKDLITDTNGEYLVSDVKFAALTETNPVLFTKTSRAVRLLSNSEQLYNLEELASCTGYNVTRGEKNIVLTRQFATRRLIVESDNPNFDKRGAIAVANNENIYVLQYSSEGDASEAYNYYSGCLDIKSVATDGLCWVEKDIETEQRLSPLGLTDEFSYQSWGVEAMGVPAYSQYIVDVLKANNNDYTELSEVVVAVLDTGIDTDHPWFENRLLVDDDGKYIGKDYTGVNETGYSFEDDDSHGTHCSGIICDMTLPNVKILPIKFLSADDDGNAIGSTLGLYNAISYITEMRQKYNIVAVNMSFGMESNILTDNLTNYFVEIFQKFYNDGVFGVVAAGNDYHDDAVNYLPAKIENAITVSALNSDLRLASYSNIGELIDVCAPGSNVNSAYVDGTTDEKSGTSMAAPHIAGYIALLRSDPTRSFTMAEIEQILSGTYKNTPTILDLGVQGKDTYYGYGMPILDGLTPEYVTVEIESGLHGTVSPLGFNLYLKDEPITIEFFPDERYYVSAVYLDDVILSDVNHLTSYTFSNLDEYHKIRVEFSTDEVAYVVNHYQEPIYDLSNPDSVPEFKDYVLCQSETLYGRVGFLTEAKAKDFTGFTALNFDQTTVTDSTIINIYYKRNKYYVSIQQPTQGIESIVGEGEYLFGDTVEVIPTLGEKFEWYIWKIEDDITVKDFVDTVPNQVFEMPATDLTLTAYPTLKTFLVTVTIIGKGTVTPNSKSVVYGDDVCFLLTPQENYTIKTICRDGIDLGIDSDSYLISNVTSDVELTVYFEKVPSSSEETKWIDITVWGGGSVVALLLFGGSVLLLVMAFRKPRI